MFVSLMVSVYRHAYTYEYDTIYYLITKHSSSNNNNTSVASRWWYTFTLITRLALLPQQKNCIGGVILFIDQWIQNISDFFLASFLYSISFFPIAESFKKGQFDKYCHRVSKVPDAYCLVTMTGYAPPGILIAVISSFRSIILYPKENEHALASHGMFFKLDYLRDQMLNSDFYFHCKFSKM